MEIWRNNGNRYISKGSRLICRNRDCRNFRKINCFFSYLIAEKKTWKKYGFRHFGYDFFGIFTGVKPIGKSMFLILKWTWNLKRFPVKPGWSVYWRALFANCDYFYCFNVLNGAKSQFYLSKLLPGSVTYKLSYSFPTIHLSNQSMSNTNRNFNA